MHNSSGLGGWGLDHITSIEQCRQLRYTDADSIILFWLCHGKPIILIPIQSSQTPNKTRTKALPKTQSLLRIWYLNSGNFSCSLVYLFLGHTSSSTYSETLCKNPLLYLQDCDFHAKFPIAVAAAWNKYPKQQKVIGRLWHRTSLQWIIKDKHFFSLF